MMGPVLLSGHAGLCALLISFPIVLEVFGNTEIAMLFALCFGLLPCFVCLAHVGRALYRNLDTLQQQLAQFSTTSARCFCCDANHVDAETGERLNCDRDVLLQCIKIWFGSTAHFDKLVQGQVRTAVLKQLTRTGYFYQQLAVAGSPVIWLFLDRSAMLLASQPAVSVHNLCDGLCWWLMLQLGSFETVAFYFTSS